MQQHTTEYIRADVCRTSTLVSQQITVANEMFAETEVSNRYSACTCVEYHVTQLQVSMNDVPLQYTSLLLILLMSARNIESFDLRT